MDALSKVNYKRVAIIAIAVLTAVSDVTGQAAELIKRAMGFFFPN